MQCASKTVLQISDWKIKSEDIFDLAEIEIKHNSFPTTDKCSNIIFLSNENVRTRIPTPSFAFILQLFVVINANFSFLIRSEAVDGILLVEDKFYSLFVSKRHGRNMSTKSKHVHLYIVWDFSKILFTTYQLKRLHSKIFICLAQSYILWFCRARTEDATPEIRDLIGEMSEKCHTFQHFKPKNRSF